MSSLLKKRIMGFTLLEIMVSVAIIAILATISIIATTRVRLKSRDIKRISNATEIVSALEAYYAANQSYPTMIFPGQPIASNGREYLRAVPSNPSPRTDGGCADTDYTYITTTTGYKLTFCIGSDNSRFAQGILICKNGNCGIKDDCSGEITDSDQTRYPIVRIGDQCWMAMNLKTKRKPDNSCLNWWVNGLEYVTDQSTCITTWSSGAYNGKKFGGFGCFPSGCIPGSRRDCIKSVGPLVPTVIGWENRGNDIAGVYDYPPVHQPSPGVYSDCNFRGALYVWSGAMNFPQPDLWTDACLVSSCAGITSSPHRGICPVGWHIPTDTEFNVLESTLTDSGMSCNSSRNSHTVGQDSCRNAGTALLTGGSSGFNAILTGYRFTFDGSDWAGLDTTGRFWTATESSNNEAIARIIDVGIPGTYRVSEPKENAYSVRCIRDY